MLSPWRSSRRVRSTSSRWKLFKRYISQVSFFLNGRKQKGEPSWIANALVSLMLKFGAKQGELVGTSVGCYLSWRLTQMFHHIAGHVQSQTLGVSKKNIKGVAVRRLRDVHQRWGMKAFTPLLGWLCSVDCPPVLWKDGQISEDLQIRQKTSCGIEVNSSNRQTGQLVWPWLMMFQAFL